MVHLCWEVPGFSSFQMTPLVISDNSMSPDFVEVAYYRKRVSEFSEVRFYLDWGRLELTQAIKVQCCLCFEVAIHVKSDQVVLIKSPNKLLFAVVKCHNCKSSILSNGFSGGLHVKLLIRRKIRAEFDQGMTVLNNQFVVCGNCFILNNQSCCKTWNREKLKRGCPENWTFWSNATNYQLSCHSNWLLETILQKLDKVTVVAIYSNTGHTLTADKKVLVRGSAAHWCFHIFMSKARDQVQWEAWRGFFKQSSRF